MPLAVVDFRFCIEVAQNRIDDVVQRFGDGPIIRGQTSTLVQWRFKTTLIRVEAPLSPVPSGVTWSQARAILAALRMKMDRAGYRERSGEIIGAEEPPVVVGKIAAKKALRDSERLWQAISAIANDVGASGVARSIRGKE
ncbi:MAG: hypothetical protein Q9207_005445 [Kuettlingeria erythrocarpa]